MQRRGYEVPAVWQQVVRGQGQQALLGALVQVSWQVCGVCGKEQPAISAARRQQRAAEVGVLMTLQAHPVDWTPALKIAQPC